MKEISSETNTPVCVPKTGFKTLLFEHLIKTCWPYPFQQP